MDYSEYSIGARTPAAAPKRLGTYNATFAGISVFPFKSPGFFNARKSPALKGIIHLKVQRVTRATGYIVTQSDGKFWLELDTPGGKSWARSDVMTWSGKKTSKEQKANGGKNVGPTKKEVRKDLLNRPVNFLSTVKQVNIRSGPGLSFSVLTVATLSPIKRTIGTTTGNVYLEGKSTWLEIMEFGKRGLGYVRSDGVHWKGSKTRGEIVEDEVIKPVLDFGSDLFGTLKTVLFLGVGVYAASKGGLFDSKSKK